MFGMVGCILQTSFDWLNMASLLQSQLTQQRENQPANQLVPLHRLDSANQLIPADRLVTADRPVVTSQTTEN